MALNVAVVGLGGIGNTHARVYQERDDTTLVAVCDLLQEQWIAVQARHLVLILVGHQSGVMLSHCAGQCVIAAIALAHLPSSAMRN